MPYCHSLMLSTKKKKRGRVPSRIENERKAFKLVLKVYTSMKTNATLAPLDHRADYTGKIRTSNDVVCLVALPYEQ